MTSSLQEECGESVRAAHPLFQVEGGGSTPTSPLQLAWYRISPETASRLNALWHSVLPRITLRAICHNKYWQCYGAEYGGMWYAVAIWTSPVAANRMHDGWLALELRRFAIAPEAPPHTASRGLKVMRVLLRSQMPWIRRLVSYQSCEHHTGTIYKAAGWHCTGTTEYASWLPRPGKPVYVPQIVTPKLRWEYVIQR